MSAAVGVGRSAGLPCVMVVGPTATGKTRLAVALARRFGGEVISADSRQVYRGLDLGTGKDLEEYGTGAERVPVHLVDIVDPAEAYHLFRYVADAQAALRDLAGRGRLPVIAGGTGLYLHALIRGYALEGTAPSEALRDQLAELSDAELLAALQREAPDLAARVDAQQRRRLVRAVEIARSRAVAPDSARADMIPLRPLLIGPYYPRAEVHARIAARLDARLQAGLIDEVARLHAAGLSWERLAWFGLEYRCVAQYLQGQVDLQGMREGLLARIRRFGKAQDAWLRKIEREGIPIHWLPGGDPAQAVPLVERFLAGVPLPEPTLRLSETLYGPRGRA